jgi:hypothetical protein
MGHTLTLDIPDSIFESLAEKAERVGQRPEALAAQLVVTATQGSQGSRGTSCQMEIHTFAPELYRVKKPIPVVVRPHDGAFLASFLDANVNASGETEQEAFAAVKALMLDMLDHLARQARLGPKLATRLSALREFIDEP